MIKLNLTGIAPYILTEIESGSYEYPEKTLSIRYLTNTDKVLELGSAIGYVGINANLSHPGIEWTSIEANPWCVARSIENYALNNVTPNIINAVASLDQTSDKIKFYVREEFWNSSLDSIELEYSKITDVVECDVVNLNDLLQDKNVFVIDIEGGEIFFIKEGGLDLSNIEKILIEFHERFTSKEYVNEAIAYISKTHNMIHQMGEVYYFERY